MTRRTTLNAYVSTNWGGSGGGGLCVAYIDFRGTENISVRPFFFEEGMTWRDFVNSEYNEFGLKVNTYGNVISTQSNRLWTFAIRYIDGTYPTPDELILNDYEYYYN